MLYDKIWRADIHMFAYRLVRANQGSPGVDGMNFLPHAKLLAVVAERIVDRAILHVIKLWLKAPVIGGDGVQEEMKVEEKRTVRVRRKAV